MIILTTRLFGLLVIIVGYAAAVRVKEDEMPLPFTRDLALTDPPMSGSDVIIACNLMIRDESVVSLTKETCDDVFDKADESATREFQAANNINENIGVFDSATANLALTYSSDGYKDSGFTAASMGYKYKIHIPVFENRSIETRGSLFDANNNLLLSFPVRAHGLRDDAGDDGWPDFGDGDYGLNQFTSNGNTPTGLVEVDLNSAEPDPDMYGPWPVNRIVRGLDGNAEFMLPNIRDGVLIHTGNWTTEQDGQWRPTRSMPNSHGCLHSHPISVDRIYQTLVDMGIEVRDNPYSGKNYPYSPQGIAVIELVK
jgi:hypothetical protein